MESTIEDKFGLLNRSIETLFTGLQHSGILQPPPVEAAAPQQHGEPNDKRKKPEEATTMSDHPELVLGADAQQAKRVAAGPESLQQQQQAPAFSGAAGSGAGTTPQ